MNRVRFQVEAEDAIKEWETGLVTDGLMGRLSVAVLDTGIGRHPDLFGNLVDFRDFVHHREWQYDDNGHGTHICGILSGSGKLSNGRLKGMAPKCRLVVGKVLDHNGDGMAKHMLQALEWILEIRKKHQIRILNISVGIGTMQDKAKEEALRKKIEELWSQGITVVCAAGNKGPEEGSISSICRSDKVITVGCHDGNFCKNNPKRCETYSGRGWSTDQIRKPDVVAPGTDVRSCNVKYDETGLSQPYVAKNGTSMATPIVSGAIALLLQKYPELNNDEVKRKLTYTATDLEEPWNLQGWGMINVKKMLEKY